MKPKTKKFFNDLGCILLAAFIGAFITFALCACDPTAMSKQIDPDEALPHYRTHGSETPS